MLQWSKVGVLPSGHKALLLGSPCHIATTAAAFWLPLVTQYLTVCWPTDGCGVVWSVGCVCATVLKVATIDSKKSAKKTMMLLVLVIVFSS